MSNKILGEEASRNLFFVTFCNIFCDVPAKSIALVNVATGKYQLICPGDHGGFTGIAVSRGLVYNLFQMSYANGGLVVFRQDDGRVIFRKRLPWIKHPHSLIVSCDDLFATSTGTDSVLRYKIIYNSTGIEDVQFVERFWNPESYLSATDKYHVNSLFKSDNNLLVGVCGLAENENRNSARNGYIFDITNNIKVSKKPIVHPHSIVVDNEDLYCCESLNRAVKKNDEAILTIDSGYARGLSLSDNFLVLGRSARRKVSKSRGVANAAVEEGMEGKCAVLVYDRNTLELIRTIDFSHEHNEIYEIIPAVN